MDGVFGRSIRVMVTRVVLVGLELVKSTEGKEPATEEAGKVRSTLRERGLLIGVGGTYGNVLRIQPPLTISDDELSQVVTLMKEVLET